MSALLDLAERCEAATGPDRELDAAIWCELNGREYPEPPYTQMLQHDRYDPSKGTFEQGTQSGILLQSYKDNALSYTASLDAAMTLVPEGCFWAGGDHPELGAAMTVTNIQGSLPQAAKAATPALALCAAALRARAAEQSALNREGGNG